MGQIGYPHPVFVVGLVDEASQRVRHARVVPFRDVDLVDPGLAPVERIEGAGVQEFVRGGGNGRAGGGKGAVAVDQARHSVPERVGHVELIAPHACALSRTWATRVLVTSWWTQRGSSSVSSLISGHGPPSRSSFRITGTGCIFERVTESLRTLPILNSLTYHQESRYELTKVTLLQIEFHAETGIACAVRSRQISPVIQIRRSPLCSTSRLRTMPIRR